jgi:hypothetical protein
MTACRPVALFLLGCSVSLAASVKDPLLRSGVWQATVTINERPVTLLLSLQIEAIREAPDGTFAVSDARGKISSPDFGRGPSGIGCFLLKQDVALDDRHVWATCTNISDQTKITLLGDFDPDGRGIAAVLTHSGTIPVHFERIPIDDASPLDGEWAGQTERGGRESMLHMRTSNGAPVATLDRWYLHGGSWGSLLNLQAGRGGITFTPSGTCCAWFYGQLSRDSQQITGYYSSGQFSSSTFVRVPKK